MPTIASHPPHTPWIMASHNPHKAEELTILLASYGIQVCPAPIQPPEPIAETGQTFWENALIKARAFATYNPGSRVIADDSGLCVAALGGAPGLHTARWAGPDATDAEKNARLVARLADTPPEQRHADFVCVLVSIQDPADPLPAMGIGIWSGLIVPRPQGVHGFGYDPIFALPEWGCTAAELPTATKNQHSHRARAVQALMACSTWTAYQRSC